MKIILPRTIAEPWTIPWFVRSNYNTKYLAQEIRNAIDNAYDALETRSTKNMLIVKLLAILEGEARWKGAIKVSSTFNNLWSTDAQHIIGYTCRIFFQVPQDPDCHVVIIHMRFEKGDARTV